ncbi:aconitase X swivel domain-containing protein [Chloroflexota bacterium]
MSENILKGHKIVGGKVEGQALVTRDKICFLATVETDGSVLEEGHDLYGKNVAGTILVYPSGRGSTSGSWKVLEMAISGTAPKAILNTRADSVAVSGAILGNIPMVHKFDKDPVEVIKTGDHVIVDADAGTVKVISSD